MSDKIRIIRLGRNPGKKKSRKRRARMMRSGQWALNATDRAQKVFFWTGSTWSRQKAKQHRYSTAGAARKAMYAIGVKARAGKSLIFVTAA